MATRHDYHDPISTDPSESLTQSATRPRDLYVTRHAVDRYRERVNPTARRVSDRIKREFREAVPVVLEDDRILDPTCIHPESGVVYVYDPHDWAVITCFIPTTEQLGRRRRSQP